MARKKHDVTPEHRAYYEARLKHWQTVLNLVDWRIELSPDKFSAISNAAEVEIYYEHRLAVVKLAKQWYEPVTEAKLDEFAVHEILHVRLADLIHVVKDDSEEKVIEAAEHTVIVVFSKLLTRC